MSERPPEEGPAEDREERGSLGDRIAASYGAQDGIRRDANGQIDVLHAVGGVRGLLEAVVPGALFLAIYLSSGSLALALIIAVGLALAASVLRLLQRGSVMQSFSGAVGVVICAVFARVSGQAIDYYVPGLWLNAAYLVGCGLSMALRWPFVGILLGFIRGEELNWRKQPARMRAYQWATGLFAGMFLLRLLVQLPLYLADNVAGIGIARIVMGVPLYALVIWWCWMISRPAAASSASRT